MTQPVVSVIRRLSHSRRLSAASSTMRPNLVTDRDHSLGLLGDEQRVGVPPPPTPNPTLGEAAWSEEDDLRRYDDRRTRNGDRRSEADPLSNDRDVSISR